MERRIHKIQQVNTPESESDDDWRILSQLAKRLNSNDFEYIDSNDVLQEIVQVVPQYKNVISESIGVKGIVWEPKNNIGKYKFTDINLEKNIGPQVSSDNEYNLTFVPGRVLLDLNKDAEIVIENNKNTITRPTVIEVNIEDAKTSDISEGDDITLVGSDFELTGKAHINGLQKGLVSSTSLFGNLVEIVASSKDPNKISNIEKLTIRKVKILTD